MAAAGPRTWLGLVTDGGEAVAAFCGSVRGLGGAGRWAAGCFECKLPLVSAPGFAFAPELDADGCRAAVGAFERALFHRLRWSCAGVAYRQVAAKDLDAFFRRRGRARLTVSPTTRLVNRWTSMDDYFAALPGRRRARLRNKQRRLASDPGLLVAHGADGVAGVEATRLAQRNLERHRRLRTPAPPPAGYFDALAREDGVLWLRYAGEGRLLAFDLTFDDGAWLTASMWGSLDPHGDGRPHLYFDRYLRLIAWMVGRGRSGIHFGKGMVEIKQRFLCDVVPQFVVAAAR